MSTIFVKKIKKMRMILYMRTGEQEEFFFQFGHIKGSSEHSKGGNKRKHIQRPISLFKMLRFRLNFCILFTLQGIYIVIIYRTLKKIYFPGKN